MGSHLPTKSFPFSEKVFILYHPLCEGRLRTDHRHEMAAPGGGPVPGGGAGNARMTISIVAAESFKLRDFGLPHWTQGFLPQTGRTHFSIRATMPFRKLFDTYCELQALSLDSLCFNFGGKELTQTQTPADVEMPDGAVIDVVESPLINCKVTGMQVVSSMPLHSLQQLVSANNDNISCAKVRAAACAFPSVTMCTVYAGRQQRGLLSHPQVDAAQVADRSLLRTPAA